MRYPALLFTLVLVFLLAAPASAQTRAAGSIGIGGQVGDPSGVTVKLNNPGTYSLDFLAAWDLDDFFFLNVHALYDRRMNVDQDVYFFYGPGAFVGLRDRGGNDDDVVLGISGSFGLGLFIDRFELFAQVTPRLSLVPSTDGDVGGGLGLRYYL